MSMSVLTQAALEQTHTAAQYLPWVKDLIAKVRSERNGIERLRLRQGLAKELMNEALPLGVLAERYFDGSSQVNITLKVGNQNFDATVVDNRQGGSLVQYIEVTIAGDGEEDYLRMRLLHERGNVSVLGHITKSGTKRSTVNIEVSDEATSQAEVLRRERDRISRAIERKLGKPYPQNTMLLLALDDTMAFDRSDNIANIESALTWYMPHLQAFRLVALVGLECGLFICRHTTNEF